MRERVRGSLITAVASTLLAGCYLSHMRPEPDAPPVLDAGNTSDADAWHDASSNDAWAFDAPNADAMHDTNPPPFEAGDCDPRWFQWARPCDDELETICRETAMTWAHGRYGWSHCGTHPDGHNSACSLGDYCVDGSCICTPTRICGPDDVCVSDTPDGPRRCVPRCSGL